MKKKRSIPVKLDKLTVLKILGIAGAAIFFYWALQNLSLLADAAGCSISCGRFSSASAWRSC